MSRFIKPSLREVLAHDAKRLGSKESTSVSLSSLSDVIREAELALYAYERSF
jgi:hypothetical protein